METDSKYNNKELRDIEYIRQWEIINITQSTKVPACQWPFNSHRNSPKFL